jgi:hypothetical protein
MKGVCKMAKPKYFCVKKEINSVEYTFQFNGISAMLEAQDECYADDRDVRSTSKLVEYLFQNVIIEPKGLTPDDFDTVKELNAVVKFASQVMQGEHRDMAIDTTTGDGKK